MCVCMYVLCMYVSMYVCVCLWVCVCVCVAVQHVLAVSTDAISITRIGMLHHFAMATFTVVMN